MSAKTANLRDPIPFDQAKASAARWADTTANTLQNYFGKHDRLSVRSVELLLHELRGMASAATQATDAKHWNKLLSDSRYGSKKIAALIIARGVLLKIEQFDTSLPEGETDDAPSALTRHGLKALADNLTHAIQGVYDNTHKLRPNYQFEPSSVGVSTLGVMDRTLLAIFHANDVNSSLTLNDLGKIEAISQVNP